MEKRKQPTDFTKSSHRVKVMITKDEMEVLNIEICNKQTAIRRLCKGMHIDIRTGEIIHDKVWTKRGDSARSLLVSNTQLMNIIKTNTIDVKKLLLLTLTYKEKQLDMERIQYDFRQFIKRLRKDYVPKYGAIEYVNVPEFYTDKSGYHLHAILFFNDYPKGVYIDADDIEKFWGQGHISVGQPKTKQEVYYYLTPNVAKEITEKNVKMHTKALLQQELPAGQKLFRCSRGIKRPIIYTDNYENVKKHLLENSYEFKAEIFYKNPMKTTRGNKLHYNEQFWQKPKEPLKPPRQKI